MKLTACKSLFGIIALLTISAVPVISAQKPLAAGGAVVAAPVEQVDLSESSRMSSEVTTFLSQPALSEALTKAKSDKKLADEASRNPNAFLSKNGVQVPSNIKLDIKPPTGGAAASRFSITITIRCCPPSATIVIRL